MATGFKTASIQSGQVPSAQSNMPLHVDLSRLGITTLAEAQSVRVYADAAKTTELAREIVSASQMWVNVSTVDVSEAIYVDWDGVRSDYATSATYGAENVWSGASYVGVWHLEETSGTRYDSTSNANDLSDGNTVGYAAGKIGNAADFEGDNLEHLSIADADQTGLGFSTSFTLSAYLKFETVSGTFSRTIFNKFSDTERSFFIYKHISNGNLYIALSSNGSSFSGFYAIAWSPTAGVEYKFDLTYDAGAIKLYIDGALHGSTSGVSSIGSSSAPFSLGVAEADTDISNPFDGLMDEARATASVRSADWIETEYNNMNDDAAFWGTWTDAGGGGSTFRNSLLIGSGL